MACLFIGMTIRRFCKPTSKNKLLYYIYIVDISCNVYCKCRNFGAVHIFTHVAQGLTKNLMPAKVIIIREQT